MLSHPLDISGLVGHYPTNYLVSHRPLLRRRTFAQHSSQTLRSSGITHSFPWLSRTRGYVPMPYYPVSRSSIPRRGLVARLACLIHAANVHSEPGSNPSIDCLTSPAARNGKSRLQHRTGLIAKQSSGVDLRVGWFSTRCVHVPIHAAQHVAHPQKERGRPLNVRNRTAKHSQLINAQNVKSQDLYQPYCQRTIATHPKPGRDWAGDKSRVEW